MIRTPTRLRSVVLNKIVELVTIFLELVERPVLPSKIHDFGVRGVTSTIGDDELLVGSDSIKRARAENNLFYNLLRVVPDR